MKQKIRQNFSRAAETYDAFAQTQRQITNDFADRLLGNFDSPKNVLEIGCGTGYLTERLSQNLSCPIVATDFSPAMVEAAQGTTPKAQYLAMDGEHLCFDQPFDWIVSSLTFQWFLNPTESYRRLKESCNLLAFTTLGPNNFPEWREFCERNDIEFTPRPHPSVADLKALLGPDIAIETLHYPEHHPNWLSFWNGIYNIGANTKTTSTSFNSQPSSMSSKRELLSQGPVTVSYEVIFAFWRN